MYKGATKGQKSKEASGRLGWLDMGVNSWRMRSRGCLNGREDYNKGERMR